MDNSKIQDVIHSCMEIEKLSDQLANDYDDVMNDIELVEDDILDEFSYSTDIDEISFYVSIKEIEIETKYIKKYAIGLMDKNNDNIIRYDNADHHDDNPRVKAINPSHHKHPKKDESDVFGSTGKLEEIIQGLEDKLNNL